ncbi:LIM/homeobox protein Lhx3 [Aspergillus udagawae]|uniref:LIM/homeobox protein Lhx3 n=1 Tax=Aspergillus udagawae TaxID=91492 RepID=A0ABQ1AMB0_9EURO|nr:LIM/homeobox protein Lhx3 [Aspergillus udagawae]
MNYLHHPYAFGGHNAVHFDQSIAYDPTMAHHAMVHPMDGYLYPHPPYEMVDYYHQPIMDYEEYAENLSRPRLTKEQVETLEAQFQAHPKPSSNVKRQLAAQTNLSLPRVANWFQNRRAKAKQQKRQEEFERMQKAKAEAEEAVRNKTDSADDTSDSNQSDKTTREETDKANDTKKSESGSSGEQKKSSTSSRSKHQKTRSESAREATFASLQRALNAAVAAREHYGSECEQDRNDDNSVGGSVSPTMFPLSARSNDHDDSESADSALNTPFSAWESAKDSSASWTSQSTQEPFGYTGLATPSFPTTEISLQRVSQGEEWASQLATSAESLPSHPASMDVGSSSYGTIHYSVKPELSKRGSSEELASTLQGIGIDTSGSPHGFSQLTGRSSWKDAGKELDLAARRKRPRPAAIGTSRSSSMLAGSSAMSPTMRLPNGASHGVRQSKSAQSLGSRYAGVRKASAAQRSPFNLATFAEGATLNSKAEMSSMLQPAVTTGALAPPTPLTPEDLHHLLPATPSDGGYCLSAQPTSHLFPTTQPMQINIASPPATPLAVDMMSSYSYQGVAPPMSAPAHYTTFPEYSSCDGAPLTGRSWADATSMPPSEQSFAARCQMEMPSVSYEQAVDPTGATADIGMFSTKDIDMHMSTGGPVADARPTEFQIQEFPEQQEIHRFVAQQLPSHKPKAYTFAANSTPHNFQN